MKITTLIALLIFPIILFAQAKHKKLKERLTCVINNRDSIIEVSRKIGYDSSCFWIPGKDDELICSYSCQDTLFRSDVARALYISDCDTCELRLRAGFVVMAGIAPTWIWVYKNKKTGRLRNLKQCVWNYNPDNKIVIGYLNYKKEPIPMHMVREHN